MIGRHKFHDRFHVLPSSFTSMILSLVWQREHGAIIDTRASSVWIEHPSARNKMIQLPTSLRLPATADASSSDRIVSLYSLTDVYADNNLHPDEDWYLCWIQPAPSALAAVTDASSRPPSPLDAVIQQLKQEFADVLVNDLPEGTSGYARPYLLKRNIIEESDSPLGFPILYSRRKNDPRPVTDRTSYRLCTDLRKLNNLVQTDPKYPTPSTDDLLEKVASVIRQANANPSPGRRIFLSAFDFLKGFLQIPVKADHRKFLAIVTPFGKKYQYRNLPFGFRDSSNIFTEFIQMVIKDLPNTFAYIDDIILLQYATVEEHIASIRRLLLRCREQQIYLKESKAKFFQEKIDFLGHTISQQGVETQQSKTTAISEWRVPCNAKDVKIFLGVAGYYRKYIHRYAELAAPLHALLRKGVPFTWSSACQTSFDKLKQALTSSPILAHFDPTLPTQVHTDASNVAIAGIVLQFYSPDDPRVVGYYSRLLTPTERNYDTTDRELLAIKDTLLSFRFYLLGLPFVLRTDNKALTTFRTKTSLTPRQTRWLETISAFAIREIQHIKGANNVIPDALSRQYDSATTAAEQPDRLLRDDHDLPYLLAVTETSSALDLNTTLIS
eukprot:721286-Hanusia_phi.AAC.3